MTQPLESMTLRSKLNEAERVIRELVHHLEHGYVPKAHLLRRVARKGNDPKEQDITDISVRETVKKTVSSDDFTRRVCIQLNEYLTSIEGDLKQIIGN